MHESQSCLVELKSISKSFPGVRALDKVDFKLQKGSVHALMGENGAGKSTLIKCLSGVYSIDEGQILFNGEEVALSNVRMALHLGIAVVEQELSPILDMTVAENIWIGREPKKGGFIDKKQMNKDTEELLKEWEINVGAKDVMRKLSTSKMQMVEIIKAVSRNLRVLILDEPTSSLSEKEVDTLFKTIKKLKSQGIGIIYVSHKMDEIFRIADNITVLRDGCFIASHRACDIDMNGLVREMVGRNIDVMQRQKGKKEEEETALEVEALGSGKAFRDISFSLHKGEILGICGLVGAGRTELLETIFGLRRADEGTLKIHGKTVKITNPNEAIKNGLALICEDRRHDGIVPLLSVLDNIVLATIAKYSKGGFFHKKTAEKDAKIYADALRVKTPDLNEKIANLSGGNQQKAIIARWLMSQADIYLFDEPTRGIDIGAKDEIYQLIFELTDQGKAVVVVSSELPEILKISDRILVMREGVIGGILNCEEATEERIMSYAH